MTFTVSLKGKDVPLVKTTDKLSLVAEAIKGHTPYLVNLMKGKTDIASVTIYEASADGHEEAAKLYLLAKHFDADYLDIII